MKKVKIMLTAIAVVSVVSGAVAFKATKFGGSLYCSSTSGTAGTCNTAYRQDNTNGSSLYCTTTKTSDGGTCATTTTKVTLDSK